MAKRYASLERMNFTIAHRVIYIVILQEIDIKYQTISVQVAAQILMAYTNPNNVLT